MVCVCEHCGAEFSSPLLRRNHLAAGCPSLAGEGAPPEGCRLVCFIACHCSTRDRLKEFSKTICSIASQTVNPTVHISWSAASPELAQKTGHLLTNAADTLPMVSFSIIEQSAPHTQFCHFRALLKAAKQLDSPPEWIYFADDDDLWAEQRHANYYQQCNAASPATDVILCNRKARTMIELERRPKNAEDVRDLLRKKVARLTNSAEHEKVLLIPPQRLIEGDWC